MTKNHFIAYQLYSSRNFPDLTRQLGMLSETGFRHVEPYDALIAEPARFKDMLDRFGLTAPTAHVGLPSLRQDFDGTIRALSSIGVQIAIAPYLPPDARPSGPAGWRQLGAELLDYARRAAEHGLQFGWHNHDFEFVPCDDGSWPIDLVLGDDPLVKWQADIAWIVRARQDPAAWLARYAPRIIGLHVKDVAAEGELAEEDGWADVGHGRLDWPALLPLMRATAAEVWTLEHDNPSDDSRFARRSLTTVSEW